MTCCPQEVRDSEDICISSQHCSFLRPKDQHLRIVKRKEILFFFIFLQPYLSLFCYSFLHLSALRHHSTPLPHSSSSSFPHFDSLHPTPPSLPPTPLSHAPPQLSSRGEDGAMRCNYSNWLWLLHLHDKCGGGPGNQRPAFCTLHHCSGQPRTVLLWVWGGDCEEPWRKTKVLRHGMVWGSPIGPGVRRSQTHGIEWH